MESEAMHYDIVIVGAGPSGLCSAIKAKQLCQEHNFDLNICVLEKGSEVGSHILAGAVLELKALNELLPKWKELNPPKYTKVTQDEFRFFTKDKSFKLPTPPQMNNHGNIIISLGEWCKWLSTIAEGMGIEIYPGFPATEFIFEDDKVIGVKTGPMGIDKNNQPKDTFQPGMDIFAKQTILAEGSRGSLSQQIIKKFSLNKKSAPQTYAIGLKEIWEVSSDMHKEGLAVHTIGWPLDSSTYGGSFIYHASDNKINIGLVVGLDYKNPNLSPYLELQRFKHHPYIKNLLQNGRVISYGARALNEGGWQSIPQVSFKGGVLVGCCAGFMNVPKIKGIHTAMKSGMLASESIFKALKEKNASSQVVAYQKNIESSWIKQELFKVRNVRPGFRWGLWFGMANAALSTYVFKGKEPWTLNHHKDHTATLPANKCKSIKYPKADNKISFDRLNSVSRTNVFHEENQPCHLQLKDNNVPETINYPKYHGLEQNYCPAGVYEYIPNEQGVHKLTINSQNCIHCKTCDIKDPTQNITWVPPEGGGGPNYSGM
jgi:electron-transferring-flavoprotein dehydrogenase